MKRDNTIYLHHMLDAMTKVDEYLQGVDERAFFERTMVQDAVIRQIEILCKAVRGLSSDLREQHTHIPWRVHQPAVSTMDVW